MRATSLPLPTLHAGLTRRGLAALFAVATVTCATVTCCTPTTVSAMDGLSLIPHFKQFVLTQPNPKTKKGKAATKSTEVEIDPALKRDKTALPPGYKIPPEKLPDVDVKKEIPIPAKVTDSKAEGYKEWRAHLDKMKQYKDLLRKGNFTDAKLEREKLRYGIKYKLARMTQLGILFPSDEDREKVQKVQVDGKKPEAPESIGAIRDDLLGDLKDTNAFNGGMEIRDAFLDLLCEEGPKLFDNNYYVRFNIALLLSTINNRDQDKIKGVNDDVPCFKALRPLLDLVNDPKQHPMYKVHPVQALARMCRNKNCSTDDRFAIIESLIKQMAGAKTQPEWYGWRLAENLAMLGDPNDRTRQPVVVTALVNVLKDAGFSYRIRSQAAHSLGRIPLEGYRKTDEIAIEMLRLGEQMALEYEKSKTNSMWKLYFTYLYLGFQPRDAVERGEKKGLLLQVESKPALAATKTVVTEAYQHFLPLAQNVLGGRASAPIPDQLRKIKVWLDGKGKPGAPGNPLAKDGK